MRLAVQSSFMLARRVQPPSAGRRAYAVGAPVPVPSTPSSPVAAPSRPPPTPTDPAWEQGEVFVCAGIEGAAVQMRRRVQLGIGLEVFGTQLVNFVFHNNWEAFVRDSTVSYFENSAALLGLHILVVWKYHSFLRDALLARHVTRIAVLEPPVEAQDHQLQTWAVLVETGPWARRLQLARQSQPIEGVGDDAVDKPRDRVPFGQLLQLGLLHVDTQRGEVLDQDTFNFLLQGDLTVVSEEVTTDVATLKYAFVSPDKLVPFLAEATLPDRSGSSIWQSLQDHEWLHRAFQVNGGRAMGFFGQLALGMGVGSVFVTPLFMSRQH